MDDPHDVYISAFDAEALAAMLRRHRRNGALESAASDELADILREARIVALERLPAGRIAMGSTATYVERPSGVQRTVTLAYPPISDATQRTISVLSPIGLALIGRKPGSVVMSGMGGRQFNVRVLETVREPEPIGKAA